MIKRPKPGENEDDLLAQQEAFLNSNEKKDVGVVIVKKPRDKITENETTSNFSIENNVVLTNIVEKNLDTKNFTFKISPVSTGSGFPAVSQSADYEKFKTKKTKGQSVFSQNFQKTKKSTEILPQVVSIQENVDVSTTLDTLKSEIHKENLNKLKEMSEEEILEEQAKLLKSLDPKLVEFVKCRAKTKENDNLTKENKPKVEPETSESFKLDEVLKEVSRLRKNEWLHMDVEEPDKFAWMSELPDKPSTSSSSSFRFDLEGRLQTSKDIETPVYKGLHHHGEEPEIPGYTVEELLPLCRSAVLSQKLIAYKVLTKITNLAKNGSYGEATGEILKKLINFDVCVLIRYGLDDSAESAVSAACALLAAILRNISQIMKEAAETDVDLSDDEFCRVDLIAGLLRMNILARLRYILEIISPKSFVCIKSIFDILFEIANRGKFACEEIFKCDRLLTIIVDYWSNKTKRNLDETILSRIFELLKLLSNCDTPLAMQKIKEYDLKKKLFA